MRDKSPTPAPSGSPPFLWALYTAGNTIFLKETTRQNSSAVFRDQYSAARHTLVETTTPLSRPSVTTHRGSQWVTWREGNTIYARALWWGPGHTRTIYEGSATPTAPALVSYQDRLVAVWGVGNTLYMSSSEFGVAWTPPVAKEFRGAIINSPVLAVHQNKLFVGLVFGWTLFTVGIKEDLTWGPNYQAHNVGEPVIMEVSLASNGSTLSMGFASGNRMYVIHSPNGYSNWTAPIEIDSGPWNKTAPPALYYYTGYLYAVFPSPSRLLMKRSGDGSNWVTPLFELDADNPGQLPAALVSSDYSVVPPTPEVVTVNDSGRPPSQTLNIVFISEGYLETEMDEFRDLVERASNTFRIITPYSKHLDKFNIYRIDVPSREKGVDASPLLAAAVRQGIWIEGSFRSPVPQFQPRYTDTALGAHYKGKWSGNHGWCAAEEPGNLHETLTRQKGIFIFQQIIYDVVEELVPGFDRTRDILYAIVNQIPEDGGTEKASFNPVVSTNDFAEGLGNIHEMAHFMANLDDEDYEHCLGGMSTDCGNNANKTINANLNDPNHKWAHFFVSEGRPGDSIVANPVSRPPDRDNFWDPSVVNANSIFNVGIWATCGITDWSPTGGAITYAPAQRCLMNHTGLITRFCPVCTEGVVKDLFARAGEPFSDTDYHNNYDHVYVEFLYRLLDDPEYPKAGFITLNGSAVTEDKFTCFSVGESELCSVDVTAYLQDGMNRLVFCQQPGFTRNIDLLSIQVVNSNGAPLPLFPVTDLSSIGSSLYFANYIWETANGNLEFDFSAHIT